jgi:hypothetical protein
LCTKSVDSDEKPLQSPYFPLYERTGAKTLIFVP